MMYFNWTTPKMLIADEGKHIRAINDTYTPEHIDEKGNKIEEHFPYYSDFIFLADGIDIDNIDEIYIEEEK